MDKCDRASFAKCMCRGKHEVWKLIEDTTNQLRYKVMLENSYAQSLYQVDAMDKLKELEDMVQKLMVMQAVKPKACEF